MCINLNLHTIRFFSLNYLYNLQNNYYLEEIDPNKKTVVLKQQKPKPKHVVSYNRLVSLEGVLGLGMGAPLTLEDM